MQEVVIDIEQHRFEFIKHPLGIDAHLTGLLKSEALPACSSHLDNFLGNKVHLDERWITRGSKVDATFDVIFVPDLGLETNDIKQLGDILKQSLVEAELWKQLRLQASIKTDIAAGVGDDNRIRFAIVLRGFEQFFGSDDVSTTSLGQGRDVGNVRPPATIPTYQLKSIHISMTFNFDANSYTGAKVLLGGTSIANGGADFVKLADASMRTFMSRRASKYPGRRMVSCRQRYLLSNLAPSVFVPGYAQMVSERADLIDPIARFLSRRSKQLATQPSVPKLLEDMRQEPAEESERIRHDLWMTMANTLKDRAASKSLKPIKKPATISVVPTECEFEDTIHNFDDPEESEDMAMLSLRKRDSHASRNSSSYMVSQTDDSEKTLDGTSMEIVPPASNLFDDQIDNESVTGSVLDLGGLNECLTQRVLEDDSLFFELSDDDFEQNTHHGRMHFVRPGDSRSTRGSECDMMDLDIELQHRYSTMSFRQMLLGDAGSDEMLVDTETSAPPTMADEQDVTHHITGGNQSCIDVIAPQRRKFSVDPPSTSQHNSTDYVNMLV